MLITLPRPLRLLLLAFTVLAVSTLATPSARAQMSTRPMADSPWEMPGYIVAGETVHMSVNMFDSGPRAGNPIYYCTGLPPGLSIDRESGLITGFSEAVGYYTTSTYITVGGLASKVLVRRIAVVARHLSAAPGYHEQTIMPNELFALGAHLTVLLQPSGAYSGSLRLGTHTVPLGGYIRPILNNEHGISAPISLKLKDGRVAKAVFFSGAGLDFQLRYPDLETPIATFHNLELMRATTGYLFPVHPGGTGRHIMAFTPTPGMVHGAGFGSAQVYADGRVLFSGMSPEGRGITCSHWTYPTTETSVGGHFYASDNATTAIMGPLSIPAPLQAKAPALVWARAPLRGRQYPAGLTRPVTLRTSRWTYAQALATYSTSTFASLQLSAEGATIPSSPFELKTLRAVFPASPVENPLKARLDLYAATGVFTGQFTLRDPDPANPARTLLRTIPYRGVFLLDHGIVAGHFQLPALPDRNAVPPTTSATSPIVSGNVEADF